ncbi:hypothetical protein EUBVEN_01265 [Eubacterium ventriosum ATCC 27560]|uniref:Uncharacterized protein n=1 Tax=Eubacterium ventriosum ATCC 27560 TaxID=411463 RepID=A5Z6D2_9FIRM|nr:hypothetical protein EUBVEN_01265 [Eubacterium ventriosum ATCC 27560]
MCIGWFLVSSYIILESTLPLPSARSGTKKLWQLRSPTF